MFMKKYFLFLLLGVLLFSCGEEEGCDCEGDASYFIGTLAPQEAVLMRTDDGINPRGEWAPFRLGFIDDGCNCAASLRICNEEVLDKFGTIPLEGAVVSFTGAVRLPCTEEFFISGVAIAGWVTLDEIEKKD